MSLTLSKLWSRKCNVDTHCPLTHNATWPRLPGANWYRIHPRSNRPSRVARGCASHYSVLGVMGSVALARGGGAFLLDGEDLWWVGEVEW